jgi:hypothetical protein
LVVGSAIANNERETVTHQRLQKYWAHHGWKWWAQLVPRFLYLQGAGVKKDAAEARFNDDSVTGQ